MIEVKARTIVSCTRMYRSLFENMKTMQHEIESTPRLHPFHIFYLLLFPVSNNASGLELL